ncbi:MAG: hypothetical protein IH957_02925 [Chloroflexi bacterium]|nr:hypothetical protein [Chloroflexota bacterium]
MPVPTTPREVVVHVHRPPVFQRDAPVRPAYRLLPPPLVVYAPRFEDRFDFTAMPGERDDSWPAALVRLDIDWTGLV